MKRAIVLILVVAFGSAHAYNPEATQELQKKMDAMIAEIFAPLEDQKSIPRKIQASSLHEMEQLIKEDADPNITAKAGGFEWTFFSFLFDVIPPQLFSPSGSTKKEALPALISLIKTAAQKGMDFAIKIEGLFLRNLEKITQSSPDTMIAIINSIKDPQQREQAIQHITPTLNEWIALEQDQIQALKKETDGYRSLLQALESKQEEAQNTDREVIDVSAGAQRRYNAQVTQQLQDKFNAMYTNIMRPIDRQRGYERIKASALNEFEQLIKEGANPNIATKLDAEDTAWSFLFFLFETIPSRIEKGAWPALLSLIETATKKGMNFVIKPSYSDVFLRDLRRVTQNSPDAIKTILNSIQDPQQRKQMWQQIITTLNDLIAKEQVQIQAIQKETNGYRALLQAFEKKPTPSAFESDNVGVQKTNRSK